MVRRKIEAVELKRNSQDGYTFELGPYNYSLHFDDGVWFLDQYRRHAKLEFVGSYQFESLNESVNFALDEKDLGSAFPAVDVH
jgi:hypothetical protein